jgi:short-subunit dehydrogenase involved in D-alanine esterification of teichoic acids
MDNTKVIHVICICTALIIMSANFLYHPKRAHEAPVYNLSSSLAMLPASSSSIVVPDPVAIKE